MYEYHMLRLSRSIIRVYEYDTYAYIPKFRAVQSSLSSEYGRG